MGHRDNMVKKKTIDLRKRILIFLIGISIASVLLIFSFQWELLPFSFTALGYDVTPYALSSILVLLGVFASSLIKSGITGKQQFDA